MTQLTIEQQLQIKTILSEETDTDMEVDDITNETLLRDDLDLDSIQSVSLMVDLEEWLGIELEGDDIANAASVGDLLSVVGLKLNEKPS